MGGKLTKKKQVLDPGFTHKGELTFLSEADMHVEITDDMLRPHIEPIQVEPTPIFARDNAPISKSPIEKKTDDESVIEECIQRVLQKRIDKLKKFRDAEKNVGGDVDSDEPPASPPPFMARQHSAQTFQDWTQPVPVDEAPAEFRKAREMICVANNWMIQTKLQGIMTAIGQTIQMDERLDNILNQMSVFQATVRKVINVAYNNPPRPESHCDLVTGNAIYPTLVGAFNRLNWRKHFFHFGLRIMLVCSTPDEIMAKLSEIVDRVSRCDSALKIGFNYLMVLTERATAHYVLSKIKEQEKEENKADVVQLEDRVQEPNNQEENELVDTAHDAEKDYNSVSFADAKKKLEEIFAEYVDQHKDNAFRSVMIEPAKAYFASIHDIDHLNHVDVHGLNWFAALLIYALGVQLPVVPLLEDGCTLGVGDHWEDPAMKKIWDEVRKSEYFGAEYTAVPAMKSVRCNWGKSNILLGSNVGTPEQFVNQMKRNAPMRERAAQYAEKFAYFFSEEFFLKKMFEVLNQEMESRPELLGFRDSVQVVFDEMKRRGIIQTEETGFVDWVYDEYVINLDVQKIRQITDFVGFTIPKAVAEEQKNQ
jgi:hypothetical protein